MKKYLRRIVQLVAVVVCLSVWSLLPWYGAIATATALVLWLLLTRSGRRTLNVTLVGLATLPSRWGAASVIVVGIAGVVGVLVALLAMGTGLQATLRGSGSDDTAIVLRAGARTEASSLLSHEQVLLIEQASGVLRGVHGKPVASPELLLPAPLRKQNGQRVNAAVRGVGPESWIVHSKVRIIAGRKFTPGTMEVDVGEGVMQEFKKMTIGSHIEFNHQHWTVVGEFNSHDVYNSEIWADLDTVGPIYHRGTNVSSATVKLTSPSALGKFKAALAADPQLNVTADTTQHYFATQSGGLNQLIRVVGTTIALIMAIGAIFGALNSMYAAVASRSREIATLRALGFRGGSVVVSVLLETVLLALVGGAVGAFVAWAIFGHYTASTTAGGMELTPIIFKFRVAPALVWDGLKWALAIGFIGGLFPALRAARLPVVTALREP